MLALGGSTMKKTRLYILMLMLFMLVASLVGCNPNGPLKDLALDDINNKAINNDNVEYQDFMADVISSDGTLIITPDKDTVEFSSSDRISVAVSDAELIDNKGNVADINILKPGDRIKIYYNGIIAESYPAQITADRIELIGRNQVIDGFLALTHDIYQEDIGLNGGITMIAFDTSEWTMLTEIETEIILAIVEEKYNREVVEGTFDELAEQKLIDKEDLYFEKGILIEIKGIEINKDKDKIECSIKKWRSGLGAIGWDAEAKLNKDTWEITRSGMWIS